MTSHSERRGDAGFTLVELMVVLAILGLALAVLPLDLRRPSSSALLRAQTAEIAAALEFARGTALAKNRDTLVIFDLPAKRYTMSGSERVKAFAGSELVMATRSSRRFQGKLAQVRFRPDGTSSGARMRMSRGAISYDITVDWLTSRVQIARGGNNNG